jgi:type II secretory pathway pseudopilin PulG
MISKNPLKNEKGYTLAVVVVFTSVLLVGLSEAMINWQKAMQREREEELIFRGKQFIRAIDLWQRKFPNTWPTTIDALLNTNNVRFLRKKWKDPITNSEEWRLIKMNPDGSISGLTIIPSEGLPGATIPGAPGQRRAGSSSSSTSGQSSTSVTSNDPFSQASGESPASSQTTPQAPLRRTGSSSTSASSSGTPVLGGICGVASTSKQKTIKTYNGRSKYNEWEFYYVPQQQLRPAVPPGRGQPAGGTGTNTTPAINRPGQVSPSPFPQQPFPGQQSP